MSDPAPPESQPFVWWVAVQPAAPGSTYGVILYCGTAHPEDVPPGAHVFDADPGVSSRTHYLDLSTGAFVALNGATPKELDPASGDWIDPPAPPAPTLDELKVAKAGEVGATLNDKIAAGLLVDGLHVQIDDGARGNLIGLVTMAGLVRDGLTTWPDGYSRGWVTAEGPRIPLPTPQDGVNLALAASAYYSALVQHAQDLVDAIAAAADTAALATIDITAGWPANT